MGVVTRIAPSPSGFLHLGTARSALFNYLWACHNNGKFVIRIEDTDAERSKKEYEESILENLAWLGIEYDELYRQSDHNEAHKEAIQKLLDSGAAYVSKEPAKDDPGREVEIVRFKNPNKEVSFTDLVRGEVTVDTSDLGDFVIARSVTDPLHHLAVVVDDADEGVTLAMRGEDLLSNTPRQILIQEALGIKRPDYLHLPLILDQRKGKLSKSKGAKSLTDYRDEGFLPEALLNYIALLGWHPEGDQEIFSKEELIKLFDIQDIQKGGAMFDEVKLRWVNKEHLEKKSDEDFLKGAKLFLSEKLYSDLSENGRLEKLLPELRERVEVYSDVQKMETDGDFDYFVTSPEIALEKLHWKKDQNSENTKRRLERVQGLLKPLQGKKWTPGGVKEALWSFAEEEGKGEVLWPLRYALSGREKSPDPFSLAAILGKDETLERIKSAINLLAS